MSNHHTTIAIIPAKGYSRRVPNKNMRLLGGKPLLYYTITAALKCTLVDAVYVSTEDPRIADFAQSAGASVPFLRDASLSGDAVHSTEPTLDMLRRLYPDAGTDSSLFCLRILPPYPFLSSDRIADIVVQSTGNFKNVISLAPLYMNIFHLRTRDENGDIHPVADTVPKNFQMDAAPELFALSGAAQCAPAKELVRHGTYHYTTPRGYALSRLESFEVDTLDAFTFAEKIIATL